MNAPRSCLLVDDEPDILELLVLTLESIEVTCHTTINIKTASDIKIAKQLLHTYHFDVCLTDIVLPDGDGIDDLLIYIKKHYTSLPVIVFSASGMLPEDRRQLRDKTLEKGAYAFLSKPVDNGQLRNLVKNALECNGS